MEIKQELLDIEGIKSSKKPLIDLFIRRTAVLTSTPEYIVEKIVKDQWKEANRRSQADSDVSEFDFPSLGTFFISPAKAKKRIARMEKYSAELSSTEPSTDEREEKKRLHKIKLSEDIIKSIKYKTKQSEN